MTERVTEPNVDPRLARTATGTSGLLTGTRAALGGVAGTGRASAVRAEGAAWFDGRGFPSPRDEAWRFTPLAPVLRTPYAKSAARPGATEPFAGLNALRVVLSNGRLEDVPAHGGLEVGTVGRPFPGLEGLLESHLGRAARIDDGFTAQNAALFDDAVVIRVKAGTTLDAPIEVLQITGGTDGPLLSVPRILVVAEPGSDATILQAHVLAGRGPVLESSVTELIVSQGARLEHVRVHEGVPNTSSVARVSVRQGKDSTYASRVFSFGGPLSRLTLDVTLEGEGASATLDGLYLVDTGEIVDHHTTIDHASPRCSSRERYKGTIDGTGLGVFDGTVVVRPGASGTEAHQENRNLLLSNDAIVHTKPHLRIDTDDVKCSHGATVGRLDPNQLFYLRSRGIDENVARSVLTFAFAHEMTEGVRSPELRELLAARIAGRLPGGELARELA